MPDRASAEHSDTGRIVRKVVWRIMPMVLLMYVLAYLDRANIGFAQSDVEPDLGLSASAFALGAGLFFIGYAGAEIPSNMLMAKVGAKVWLARIMVTFGLVAALTAAVQGESSFYIARFLLGTAEGGLFPGVILYLTYWVPAQYRTRVVGYFIFGAPLAFVVGSPISQTLLTFDGALGMHGWQWMFLVTGVATVVVGVWAFFYLDNTPSSARFLSEQEKALLVAEMAKDIQEREKVSPRGLFAALVNWRILYYALAYFTIQVGIFGVTFYLPTRIAAITGHKAGLDNALLTMIPWAFSILAIVVTARIADRNRARAVLAFSALFVGGLGVVIGAVQDKPLVALIAFCFAAGGFMSVQPMFWAWPTGMLVGTAAAGATAFIGAIGNLGGFVAPNVKTAIDSGTDTGTGGLIALGLIAIAGSLLFLGADAVRRSQPITDQQLEEDHVAQASS